MKQYDFIPQAKTQKKLTETNSNGIKYAKEPDLINDTNAEIEALIKLNKPSNDVNKEKDQRKVDGNSRFWFAVYFQTEGQKKEFLDKIGASNISAGQYINGLEFAKKLGVQIERQEIKPNIKRNKFYY